MLRDLKLLAITETEPSVFWDLGTEPKEAELSSRQVRPGSQAFRHYKNRAK